MMQTLLNNRYRIIRALGSGGFGETYLAEDTQMPSGRRCVIKQLKLMINSPKVYQLVKERFQREAAILEELGAANNQIPQLYAYFESNGQFYLVQEWIDGVTLTAKVQQEGNLSESSVKEILIGILAVLNYVHGKRIVHRDIKPDNIILRYSDGKPVLIDFGAVRETMGTVITSKGNTALSIVIGTPGFMPSEQSAGRPVYASDIYSLGLTAIYLLTRKIPQEIETDPGTAEILWRRYALSVSPTLVAILDKAIQSHPGDRYSSAREMLDALESSATVQIPAASTGMGDWQKAVIMSSLIGGFVLAGIVLSRPQTLTSSQPSPSPTTAQQPTPSSPSAAPSQSPPSSPPPTPKTSQAQQPSVAPVTTSSNSEQTASYSVSPGTTEKFQSSFYFVADSAFSESGSATDKIRVLKAAGYGEAGMFWIPDYPNLSGKLLFEVYAAKFGDRQSCANFLRSYSQRNSDAYCAFASKDRNLPADRFYAGS